VWKRIGENMKKAIVAILAVLWIIGGYFTFVSSPWEAMCPGIQTNDLSTMDKHLSKR
jgi:TRAP-type C4-dicarboxylate transport system permease large subunit